MRLLVIFLLALMFTSVSACAVTRSSAARTEFVKRKACPATKLHKLPCPGYIIDHIKALDCGGKDSWRNMQWQTVKAAKKKDLWERNGPTCKHRTNGAKPAA